MQKVQKRSDSGGTQIQTLKLNWFSMAISVFVKISRQRDLPRVETRHLAPNPNLLTKPTKAAERRGGSVLCVHLQADRAGKGEGRRRDREVEVVGGRRSSLALAYPMQIALTAGTAEPQ